MMKKQRAIVMLWFIRMLTIIAACSLFFLFMGSQLASAEGGKIAFSKLIGNNFQIVVTDENGQNMQNLSKNSKNDSEPSWSFDGKHIAFVSDREGNSPLRSNVYIMDADGSNQHLLTKKNKDVWEHCPSFSPDGKKLVFTRETGWNLPPPIKFDSKIYTIDINGGNEKYLADGYGAKWSSDGKKMVFLPFENDAIQCIVTIMDTSNKDQVRIRKGCDPSWSLDSKHIAFTSYDGVSWEIYKMDSDGKNVVCLTNGGPSWWPVGPSWSPDGKNIVFYDVVSNATGAHVWKIYKVSADGGASIPISEGGCKDPSWFDPAFANYAVNPLSKSMTLWGKIKSK